jgi:hypothetical protein
MATIDRRRYEDCLERLTELLTGMVEHAAEVSAGRCPYKDRLNQCTASFGCRNKRKPLVAGAPPLCAGDDKLDYRGAWETS